MKYTLLTVILATMSGLFLKAQLVTTLPQVSPKAKTVQVIGLTDIAVKYHRPSVNDREIWGNLIPYDQVWRAGANENTIFYCSDDIEVEGQPLMAGKYGLHMIPGQAEWTVIFSSAANAWGSYTYDPAEDALRVKVKPKPMEIFQEQLAFEFTDVDIESATCLLRWERLAVPFRIKANTHDVVVASLRDELRSRPGFSWMGWNEAANYCLQNGVNLQEATAWANRSVFMQPNVQNMVTHAKLTAAVSDQKNKEEVIIQTLNSDLSKHAVTWLEYQGLSNYAMQTLEMPEQAMEWSEKAVTMHQNMSTMLTKAMILDHMGKPDKAKKIRDMAIEEGSNVELNAYGYQLLASGKTAEAVKIFKANTDKYPEDPNVWDSLGEGYMANGQKEEAVKALKKSLSMNPPPNVKANSIRLLKKAGIDYEPGT